MKIGLVIYGSLELVSGGFLYDRMMVEYLRRQGDQVHVIGLPWRSYARHLGDNLSAGLIRHLAGLDLDVLIQDELNHPSLFWVNTRLHSQVRYPIVSIVHHLRSSELRPVWQNRLFAKVERRYLRSVDGFIFNSRTTSQVVAKVLGAAWEQPNRPWVMAYPAGDRLNPQIQEAEIRDRAMQTGPLRLVFLGNVISRKGLHTLLAALAQLSGDSWELAVIGSLDFEPRYARAVQQQALEAGLSHRVHFEGALNGAELADTLINSHVLAVPSSYEGFGIVYVEGMGFGLPAIASLGGAASEIIAHGRDGFLVPPEDAHTTAKCLQILLRDRSRLAQMGTAARRRYLAHPTWEQTGRQIREFLLTVVAKSR